MRAAKGVLFVVVFGLLVAGSRAWCQPSQELSGRELLAALPQEVLAQLPAATVDGLLDGSIPAIEFGRAMGVVPPRPEDVNETYEGQFITNWLYNSTCVKGGIDDDPIGEATLDGRCSGQPMTSAAGAPSPSFWTSATHDIFAGYYNAPYDSATCSSDIYDLTRYYVAWIKSPSPQSVRAWLGAADLFKFWVNGTLVLSRTSGGMKPFTIDEYKADVTLQQGWNLLVMKHSFPQLGPASDPEYDHKYKRFSLRFVSDDAGTPVSGLIAAFDHQCDESGANPSLGRSARAVLPVIAHLPGVGTSAWVTDLTLFNGMHMRWEVRLNYYKEGSTSGTPDKSVTLLLDPFSIVNFEDALHHAGLFGVTGDEKGFVCINGMPGSYFQSRSGYEWAVAKMYNQAAGGTFGMALPVISSSFGSGSPIFYGLRNGAYRTNFGMVPQPAKDAVARVKLTLFGPDIATPVSQEFDVTGYWQLNNVFSTMGLGSVDTATAMLSVEVVNTGGVGWFKYVTVNDGNPPSGPQGSSDPVFLWPGGYWTQFAPSP